MRARVGGTPTKCDHLAQVVGFSPKHIQRAAVPASHALTMKNSAGDASRSSEPTRRPAGAPSTHAAALAALADVKRAQAALRVPPSSTTTARSASAARALTRIDARASRADAIAFLCGEQEGDNRTEAVWKSTSELGYNVASMAWGGRTLIST